MLKKKKDRKIKDYSWQEASRMGNEKTFAERRETEKNANIIFCISNAEYY